MFGVKKQKMENIQIQNDFLKVSINHKGAELAHIQDANGKEYMWEADPQFWGRHSSILFPYIGKVFNDKYRIGDQIFEGKQHGFARNTLFERVVLDKAETHLQLKYNEETLKAYPYKFCLNVKYVLVKNQIKIIYEVENLDKQTIYFSIGAHPAFKVPLLENETRADYTLEFDKDEWVESLLITDGYLNGNSRDLFNGKNNFQITDNLFDQDALIFKNMESTKVSLVNKEGKKIWTFDYFDFSYLGIWSKNEKSPFICIEPWMGVADKLNANWDFREKEGIIALEIGKKFECTHTVTIH